MRILVFFLFITSSFYLDAFECVPLGEPKKVVNNHIGKGKWVIFLEDNSHWEVLQLEKNRKRTWSEWFNRITPVEWGLEIDYFFDPKKWNDAELQVYELEEDDLFPGYYYLLVDQKTGFKTYAKYITLTPRPYPLIDYCQQFLNYPYGEERRINSSKRIGNIIFCDDQTIWQVLTAEKEPDWFSELFGKQYIPPEKPFVTSLNHWLKNDLIQIYKIPENNKNHEIYDPRNRRKHLSFIINTTRNEYAYCWQMTFAEFENAFVYFAQVIYNRGYSHGYSDRVDDDYRRYAQDCN